MEDLADLAISSVARHPAVTRVELAGSRSRGTHEELSDWDFAVTTPDFRAVARDLPALVEPLRPISAQWEPLGHFPVYQVMLRGPTKVEYLFLDHAQEARPPLEPSADALRAIDAHFWDWIWWITTKAAVGRVDLVAEHLPQLHRHLLAPLGSRRRPRASTRRSTRTWRDAASSSASTGSRCHARSRRRSATAGPAPARRANSRARTDSCGRAGYARGT
jgi:hypothetical protein